MKFVFNNRYDSSKKITVIANSGGDAFVKAYKKYGDISGFVFYDLDFSYIDMSNINLSCAEFSNCRFSNANFYNAQFVYTKFWSCIFDWSTFNKAFLENTKFEFSVFRYCKHYDTDISKVEFKNCIYFENSFPDKDEFRVVNEKRKKIFGIF